MLRIIHHGYCIACWWRFLRLSIVCASKCAPAHSRSTDWSILKVKITFSIILAAQSILLNWNQCAPRTNYIYKLWCSSESTSDRSLEVAARKMPARYISEQNTRPLMLTSWRGRFQKWIEADTLQFPHQSVAGYRTGGMEGHVFMVRLFLL